MGERSTEPGDAQVVVYLTGVTDDQAKELVDGVCDVLQAAGLGTADPDDAVKALVGLRAAPFPDLDDAATCKAFLDDHVLFAIPNGGEEATADAG